MNAQERMNTYGSNMRVIGYLFNSVKDNYSEMNVEDFQSLTGEITRLFQASAELLPSANMEPEPIIFAQQPGDPLPLERNLNETNITMTRGSSDDLLRTDVTTRYLTSFAGDDDYPTDEELRENNLTRDRPEVVNLLDQHEDDTSSTTSEDYQDYISYKKKPRLTAKCFSNKDGREKSTECAICFEEHSLKNTLTFGCGHEFCNECVCDHFHFSVTNQPYKKFYACPTCRNDVKKVRVNYSKNDAKNKEDLMTKIMTYEIRTYCNP